MKVAIIPARGGSKRIPHKNIKLFQGQPMISWSIQSAQESGCFDRIIVSTDDDEIARIAVEWGAEVPFKRPAELADDITPTIPVVAHAINWLIEHGQEPDAVCCVYATAPFLQANKLQEGLDKLLSGDASYCFSATNFAFPIQRAIRVQTDGYVEMFQPEHVETRSQDLEEAFHDAGQFYWGRTQAWLEAVPMIGPKSQVIYLPHYLVQDIDTPEDWRRAELLFGTMQNHPSSEHFE